MTLLANGTISRRLFLVSSAVAGGGLMLGVGIPDGARAAGDSEGAAVGAKVNNWIIIQPDNTIIVRIARSEMGQGSFTALPMLVCEELECDWSKVKGEYASATDNLDNSFGSMSTGGSRAIRDPQEMLRKAGARARGMLPAAAGPKRGGPRAALPAANNRLSPLPTRPTLS